MKSILLKKGVVWIAFVSLAQWVWAEGDDDDSLRTASRCNQIIDVWNDYKGTSVASDLHVSKSRPQSTIQPMLIQRFNIIENYEERLKEEEEDSVEAKVKAIELEIRSLLIQPIDLIENYQDGVEGELPNEGIALNAIMRPEVEYGELLAQIQQLIGVREQGYAFWEAMREVVRPMQGEATVAFLSVIVGEGVSPIIPAISVLHRLWYLYNDYNVLMKK